MTDLTPGSSRVIVDISPSADGFVAGAGVEVGRPFGDAELTLYRWLGLQDDPTDERDREAAEWQLGDAGAIVLGRTMFDVGIGPWGDDGAFHRPCFVVTNRSHEPVVKGHTSFTFVEGGPRAAVEAAREAAGDKDVMVVGGARVIDQCLEEGLVDEVRMHIAPVLLGTGTRLFDNAGRAELVLIDATAGGQALHVRYRVEAAR